MQAVKTAPRVPKWETRSRLAKSLQRGKSAAAAIVESNTTITIKEATFVTDRTYRCGVLPVICF